MLPLRYILIPLAVFAMWLGAVLSFGAPPDPLIVEIDGQRLTYDLRKPTTKPTDVGSKPPVIVPPGLPALERKVAPSVGDRALGAFLNKDNPSLRSTLVQGWGQNIHATGNAPLLLEDVFTLFPFREKPKEIYYGQCLYIDSTNTVTIRGYYARGSWGREAPTEQTAFRHCIYRDFGGKLMVVEDSWIDGAAACLLQSRCDVVYRRCFLTDGAVGVAQVMGNGRIEDSTIYGGHHYFQPAGEGRDGKPVPAAWTSNVAISLYAPLTVKNVWAVGKPGQGDNNNLIPGVRHYNVGAVVGSASYGKEAWKPVVDKDKNGKTDWGTNLLTTEGDCRLIGWPGPNVSGDLPPSLTGWTITTELVDVVGEVNAIRAKMEARQISVKEAVEQAQMAVRAAAVAKVGG